MLPNLRKLLRRTDRGIKNVRADLRKTFPPTTRPNPLAEPTFTFRGNLRAAIDSTDEEILSAGPAGSGKTIANLYKCYRTARDFPGARVLIVRKTRESLTETVLVSFERDILGPAHPILVNRPVIRRVRQDYAFPNGSSIVVGGIDKPGKILSSEYDCVIGETLVDSPSRIERAYSRPYSGDLITINTAAGHELTGTPNHPVLTDQGWVGLGFLGEGNYVVSRRLVQNKSSGTNPDVTQGPTPITDVASSLALAQTSRTERHVTVPMDFHGDATDGYVDVVTADGLFHDRFGSAGLDPLFEFQGGGRNLEQPKLMSRGAFIHRGVTALAPLVPDLRRQTEFAESFSVGFGVDPLLTSRFGSGDELGFPRRVVTAGESERLCFGDGSDRDAAGGHFSLQAIHADADALGGIHDPHFAADVALDRVVKIRSADGGRGRHVYNLQTGDNWYYTNGIISHNCIYCPEATELTLEDWETLAGRLRSARVPYQQIIADCNPTTPHHFLYKRWQSGLLTMLNTTHKDNPRYYDDKTNDWTDLGRQYLARLERMTGARRDRFLRGLWVAAEGVVYDYDPAVHLHPADWKPDPKWRHVWGIDWGKTAPTVLLVCAVDDDGRIHVVREFYKTRLRPDTLAKWAARELDAANLKYPAAIVCDHDEERKADFERASGGKLTLQLADKTDRDKGIEALQSRFDVGKDDKPMIQFHPRMLANEPDRVLVDAGRPTSLLEELPAYVWDEDMIKDEPIPDNDHSCDALRYVCRYVDKNLMPFAQQPRRKAEPILPAKYGGFRGPGRT